MNRGIAAETMNTAMSIQPPVGSVVAVADKIAVRILECSTMDLDIETVMMGHKMTTKVYRREAVAAGVLRKCRSWLRA